MECFDVASPLTSGDGRIDYQEFSRNISALVLSGSFNVNSR